MNASVSTEAMRATVAAAAAQTIPITVFSNPNGAPAGKAYDLVDGKPQKRPNVSAFASSGKVLQLEGIEALGELVIGFEGDSYISSGVPANGMTEFPITTKARPKAGAISRSKTDFVLPSGIGIALLDHDRSPQTPAHLQLTMDQILITLSRALSIDTKGLSFLQYPSSSSFIEVEETGVSTGLRGHHTLLIVKHAADWPRALGVIYKRLIVAAFGYVHLRGDGRPEIRTVVDKTTASDPSRAIFAGRAQLGPGLAYGKRGPRYNTGEPLDTRAAIPDLTPAEEAAYTAAVSTLLAGSQAEAASVRSAYKAATIAKMTARGTSAEAAERAFNSAAVQRLQEPWEVVLSTGEIVTVKDILDNPGKYHGMDCCDPVEPDYDGGRAVAKIYTDKAPMISSLAHGGANNGKPTVYVLERGASEFDVIPPLGASTLPLPEFKRSDKGKVLADKSNVVLALTRPDICGLQLKHDSFRCETMVAPPGSNDWRSFRDVDYTAICLHLERNGFVDISTERIRNAVAFVADRHRFDSAQSWLSALEWDGVSRVDTFLSKYFGTDETPYTRAVSRYLWTAFAGRVMEPGIKVDMVPVAVGAQGAKKSSAVAAIAPAADFFLELDLGSQDDDLARLMRGKLVIELGELKGLRAREMEHVKSFLTRRHEEWVPKYSEMQIRYARRCVIIGTTNKDEFLQDDTGHRRWLPFCARECDPQGIADDRDQLWAEAHLMFVAEGVLWRDAESLAKLEHDAYVVRDPWEEPVEAWLLSPASSDLADDTNTPRMHVPFTAVTALRDAVGMEERALNHAAKERMAAVLKSLGRRHGFDPQRVYIDGKRARGYAMST